MPFLEALIHICMSWGSQKLCPSNQQWELDSFCPPISAHVIVGYQWVLLGAWQMPSDLPIKQCHAWSLKAVNIYVWFFFSCIYFWLKKTFVIGFTRTLQMQSSAKLLLQYIARCPMQSIVHSIWRLISSPCPLPHFSWRDMLKICH